MSVLKDRLASVGFLEAEGGRVVTGPGLDAPGDGAEVGKVLLDFVGVEALFVSRGSDQVFDDAFGFRRRRGRRRRRRSFVFFIVFVVIVIEFRPALREAN